MTILISDQLAVRLKWAIAAGAELCEESGALPFI